MEEGKGGEGEDRGWGEETRGQPERGVKRTRGRTAGEEGGEKENRMN